MQDRHAAAVDELGAALRRFSETLADTMSPAVQDFGQAVVDAWAVIYPQLRAAYAAAGEPYGPEDEGMWRWLDEAAAQIRARYEAEQERVWQVGLARLREQTAARRQERADA